MQNAYNKLDIAVNISSLHSFHYEVHIGLLTLARMNHIEIWAIC